MDHLTLPERQRISNDLLEKYPTRIPVLVSKTKRSKIQDIDKKKYLVPSTQTLGQFVYIIRKRISLEQHKALFVFVNNILPPISMLMSEMYEKYKDEDGFLYISYSGENAFGSSNLFNSI